jgi:hypothetical protein
MNRKPYPCEIWKAQMEWWNEERSLQGIPPWILRRPQKRQATAEDLSRVFLALMPGNDPYWGGMPAERPLGEWFAEIHRCRVGNVRRHIRGIFYTSAGEDPDSEGKHEAERWPEDPASFPKKYEQLAGTLVDKENYDHWFTFQQASKYARKMGSVDPRLIVDSRTLIDRNFYNGPGPEPRVVYEPPTLELPDGASRSRPDLTEATASVEGHIYPMMVPSLVEIWVEEELDSEDRPIIGQVAESLGANVITGSGNMRSSQAYAALRRQQEAGGIPLRILFLSDFDAGGDHMAVSPARHIQYALDHPTSGVDSDERPDVRLFHLALTEGQVREQGLPAKPPSSKKEEQQARERYFNERTGDLGTVQLNSLTDTGARAEWFERLLRDAITALRDPDLRRKWREARAEADELVEERLEGLMRWPHRGLQLVSERFREVATSGFEQERQAIAEKNRQISELIRERMRLEGDLRQKLSAELDPLRERGEAILELGSERIERLDELELPTYEAEEPEDAAEGWLFDSRRDYVEQQLHYNHRKFGTPIPEVEDEDLEDDDDDLDW